MPYEPIIHLTSTDLLCAIPHAIATGAYTATAAASILQKHYSSPDNTPLTDVFCSAEALNFYYAANTERGTPPHATHFSWKSHSHTHLSFVQSPELLRLLSFTPTASFHITPDLHITLPRPLSNLPSPPLTLSTPQLQNLIQTHFPDFAPSNHSTAFFSQLQAKTFAISLEDPLTSPTSATEYILRIEITTPFSTLESDYEYILHDTFPVSPLDAPYCQPHSAILTSLRQAAYTLLGFYLTFCLLNSHRLLLLIDNLPNLITPHSPEGIHHLCLYPYQCRTASPYLQPENNPTLELTTLLPKLKSIPSTATIQHLTTYASQMILINTHPGLC